MKFKLIIQPVINPKIRNRIAKILEDDGYKIHRCENSTFTISSDIIFSRADPRDKDKGEINGKS